ncbi:hypothetical protein E1B28_006483 [Marasmius oreades]|uniref:Uncharacterized protein n=1 Tax=Marasmius oreades TaxID=181124 RepID=A0A9P7UWE4_9AGAR|nr:uncharacterized protein E1B28_006483 [Marasmius oreades]KAG7095779.1 hypothetical protein E1B28_006483 [Marasmius oreades]
MYIAGTSTHQNFCNASQLSSNRFGLGPLRTTIAECERAYDRLAYSQAPLNIATAVDTRVNDKYSGFFELYRSAREDILSKRNCLNPPHFTIPNPGEYLFGFSELVLHVFIRCVYDSSERGSPLVDLRIPSPTDWPSIFPAYSTLKTYLDLTSPESCDNISGNYLYIREYITPGITSLFVLPFLEMLKERKDDPAVVLAVHMRVLSYIRKLACPYIGPSWILLHGEETVCKEEMEEFVRSQEVVQWFGHHRYPQDLKDECDAIVQDIEMATRNERIKATLHHLEEERTFCASLAGHLWHS